MLMSPRSPRRVRSERREPTQLRDRYGRNEYGESFLLARRLVESGVRLVTVVWSYICPDGNVANVWDNHGGTGSLGGITGYQMLKEKYCLPPLDQAYSALLEDLSERGLLDETLVVDAGRVRPHAEDQQGRGPRPLGRLPVGRAGRRRHSRRAGLRLERRARRLSEAESRLARRRDRHDLSRAGHRARAA